MTTDPATVTTAPIAPSTSTNEGKKEGRVLSPNVDAPAKRRRKVPPSAPRRTKRRDNRKSRHDATFIGDDERHNAEFSEFYAKQGIVKVEEFEQFLKTLARPLPSCFRILSDSPFREQVLHTLRTDMMSLFERVKLTEEKKEGAEQNEIKPLQSIPWYPENLAWSVSVPRQMLRRDNVLSPFHKLLVKLNEIGAINRQECVSMIPPLLLDVQPGHLVIDLCAAPGSKTAQILEFISKSKATMSSVTSPGCVIANDNDLRRCWMLTHQLKRFNNSQLIVTNHDAQMFPSFMTFDRVLCDVPCSGDGTLRKAPDIWRRWNTDMGIALHRLQRQIVERGVEILKPGGTLVYSTCSLNPLENEAIVAHVLRKYGDQVELIDSSDKLPHLIRRNGLTNWYIKDKSIKTKGESAKNEVTENTETDTNKTTPVTETKQKEEQSSEDPSPHGVPVAPKEAKQQERTNEAEEKKENTVEHLSTDTDRAPIQQEPEPYVADQKEEGWFSSYAEVPFRRRKRIVESLFPPSAEELESGKFPLERCMRLVPHDQDTGGFFVAVFKKKETAILSRRQRRQQMDELETEKKVEQLKFKDQTEGTKIEKPEEANSKVEHETVTMSDAHHTEEKINGNGMNAEPKEVETKPDGKSVVPESEGDKSTSDKPKKEPRASKLIADDALVEVRTLSPTVLDKIVDYFGIDRHIGDYYLLTRGSDGSKIRKIVVVSRTARSILRHGIGSRDIDKVVPLEKQVLRVVNAGVRVLERTDRNDTSCQFRLIHEGIGILRSSMKKRVFNNDELLSRSKIVELLKEKDVPCEGVWKQVSDELGGSGSAVIVCEGENIIVWVGRKVINLVMTPDLVSALLMKFDNQEL